MSESTLQLSTKRYLVAIVVNLVLDLELRSVSATPAVNRKHTHLSRVGDGDGLNGAVAGALLNVLDGVNNVHALEDVAEDNVAAVEPAGLDSADEELGAVRVLAGVGHRWERLEANTGQPIELLTENTGAGVLQLEVLVGELVAVDRLAATAIARGEVTTLDPDCQLREDTI